MHSRIFHILNIIFFLTITLSSIVFSKLHVQFFENEENRILASKESGIEKYWNDHFGLRNEFVRISTTLRYEIFGDIFDKVIIGSNGWLFLDNENAIEYYQNKTPFTDSEIKKWHEILNHRHQWLHDRGIDYYFVVVPNKSSIYGEYLPDWIQKDAPLSRRSQLEQYNGRDAFQNSIPFPYDLFRGEQLTYLRTDTHWNYLGAYIGYKAIMGKISNDYPEVQIRTQNEFTTQDKKNNAGDLSLLMLLEYKYNEDITYIPQDQIISPVKNSLKVLVLHDSFTNVLKPYLNNSFKEVQYLDCPIDFDTKELQKIIDDFEPDIVIQETVERYLMKSVSEI